MAILGIDEVGRGPWAGPLVIGAVVLPDNFTTKCKASDDCDLRKSTGFDWTSQLADSKKLTTKRREKLSVEILNEASRNVGVMTGLGWVPARELDEVGLSEALRLATRRAVGNLLGLCDGKSGDGLRTKNRQELQNDLQKDVPFSEIIIDGTQNFLVDTEYEVKVSVLPKADAKVREVSAASIIAKVARDNYMKGIAGKYPEYGFDKHVGYGTAAHKAALEKFGPCPEHRRSFRPVAEIAQKFTPRQANGLIHSEKSNQLTNTTKQIGNRAETKVADYLKSQGHKIIARNYKTKFYEIDIVSATEDTIYFTEVKYRKNDSYGKPLEFVNDKKQKQMAFAAECFIQNLARRLERNIDDLPKRKLAAASVSGSDYQLEKWLVLE